MTSRGSADFWLLHKKLPPHIKSAARDAYKKFKQNPAHPSLRLERLRKDPRLWSVRVTRDFRAVARRYENDVWLWFWIGNHAEFDREF